jgi:hypothetical protein
MTKEKQFLIEYMELCNKHEVELESDDPYCGLVVVPLQDMPNSPKFCPINSARRHHQVST